MKKAYRQIERFIDLSIPFWLLVLAAMIVTGFFVHLETYEPWPSILDFVIVSVFMLDLVFKWFHIRNIKKFLKLYWIDILAVFPFYLFMRIWLVFRSVAETGETIQKITHETLLLRETRLFRATEALKEAELVEKEAKGLPRIISTGERALRFIEWKWHLGHHALMHGHAKQHHKKK